MHRYILQKQCTIHVSVNGTASENTRTKTIFHLFQIKSCTIREFKLPTKYTRGADKSVARPISRCILFDGENISFDVSLVICINSTNIPPVMVLVAALSKA